MTLRGDEMGMSNGNHVHPQKAGSAPGVLRIRNRTRSVPVGQVFDRGHTASCESQARTEKPGGPDHGTALELAGNEQENFSWNL